MRARSASGKEFSVRSDRLKPFSGTLVIRKNLESRRFGAGAAAAALSARHRVVLGVGDDVLGEAHALLRHMLQGYAVEDGVVVGECL